MEDSKYRQYFSNLEQFRYSPGGDADDEEEELKNSEYNFFLEKLKWNGNGESYSVEFEINSDVSIVLRYEEVQEESLEDVDGQRNFMRDSKREKAKVPEILGGFSGKARAGTSKNAKKSLKIGDEEGKKSLGDVPGQKRKKDYENELQEVAEVDPVSCKSSGGSSKLMNSVVKAESQPEVPDSFDKSGVNPELGNEKCHKSTHHKNYGSCPEVEVFTLDTPKTTKKSLEIGDEEGKKSLGDVPGQKRKRDDENELEEGAEADPVACKSSEGSSKLMNVVVKVESQPEVPDSFDKYGMNPDLRNEKCHTSTHHKNDGSCPEVEVFTLDNMPLPEGDYMPFVPSKCFVGEECGDGIRDSSPSQFREKLMDLLKIPYNGKEFDNLWREVTKRKPVQGVKELRHGRMKSYSTKTKGKSYLDWYKELKIKVEEFREDRRKVLHLLRGFFFWLKNTAHAGAFQPWMDALYLKGFDRPEIV
ncbi:Detected protein of unknown function [Hibiscus syriacus]|uniref:Uncharacterized protein n=1 Tax=Hibiscus syriacus TaxID=106335 RepID=A0A6A2Z1E0_HIBSY|nr:Detected protein of unknown function [Hibiscus syriacus]